MTNHLVLAAALLLPTQSLADPVKAQAAIAAEIAGTWGALVRLPHFTGTWSVTLEDGQRFAGDWAIVDDVESDGRLGYQRKWIHFVSSKTAQFCAIATIEPERLWCGDASTTIADLQLPSGLPVTAPTKIAARVSRYDCAQGSCVLERAGELRMALALAKPTLAQEQMVFARIHKTDLAGALHGTRVTATPAKLVVTAPTRVEGDHQHVATFTRGQWEGTRYDHEVVDYQATITIGPSPATIATAVLETARYIEDCEIGGYHGSCSGPQYQCTRRGR